jgi:hypothetical protein
MSQPVASSSPEIADDDGSTTGRVPASPEAGSPAPSTSTPPDPRPHAGPLDLLARRVLGLRDAEPRALVDLQGSLVVSAVRCILAYVVVPIALPLIAWADVAAAPLSLVLSVLAVVLGVRSLRRVWQANWTHRWVYTGFIAVVVVLLGITITNDVTTIMA